MHQLGEWLARIGHHHHDAVATVRVTFSVNGVPMSDTTLPQGNIEIQAVGLNAAGTVIPGVVFTYTTTAGTLVASPDGTELLTNAPAGDITVTATAPNGVSGSATATVVDPVVASVQVTLSPAPAAALSTPAAAA